MQPEVYSFIKRPENHYYEFNSVGPKGSIKKVVEYYRFHEYDGEVFNLAFGDWDEKNNRINVMAVTNNADRGKVLATVAATVIDFMNAHPRAILIATGSTLSRARLYQMAIVRKWNEISLFFEVQGYIAGAWKPFTSGILSGLS
jgi:hypothetical protein